MYNIEYILNKARENNLSASELDQINTAYKFALNAHQGQFRKNGDEQIVHVLTVAGIVADLNVDATTISAALLHEVIPLSNVSLDLIKEKFGDAVTNIINNYLKLDRLKLEENNDNASVYLRKVLVGLAEDARVLIIKLADRLHNMRTVDPLPLASRKQVANETSEVLIPIAHRLGINSIKSELEDLCLKYSKPAVYADIVEKLNLSHEELSESLEDMKDSISELLINHNINFMLKARVKSIHSIYKKLAQGRKWSDIYDILALRLIVSTESDCYSAIGLIHAKFRPIPKRFKDYIAMPKENMYQSLHTSVFGVDGQIFEIQIRTPEMDEIAENGIAAHWSYKEHSPVVKNIFEQKLEYFKNIIESNKDEVSDEVFAKNMEAELLSNQIYVFTPKGDVMELPQGSTPIDFAYRIHSEIGDKTVGAIVGDTIVPLDYELNDGDIIKINTSNTSKPNKDWLNFVKTSGARNKIKAYFSKVDREIYIERGHQLLEKEIRKQKKAMGEVLSEENINHILQELKIKSYDDLLLSIGSLRYTATYIINLIYEDRKSIRDIMLDRVSKLPSGRTNYKNDIIVANMDNILVSLAGCCNPVPGDPIIGYITKGQGVSVHKTDCHNVVNLTTRLIDTKWNTQNDERYFSAKLKVLTDTNSNNILELVTKASICNVSVQAIGEHEKDGKLDYELNLKVKNRSDLNDLISTLKGLKYVLEVTE